MNGMIRHYKIVLSSHYDVAKCGMRYYKVRVQWEYQTAAGARRFKMSTENDMVIMQSEDTRGYLMLMLELGLDRSKLHW